MRTDQMLFWKYEEKTCQLEDIFFSNTNYGDYNNHRLEYRDKLVMWTFEGRGIFLSEISNRGA